jgi:O-antigen/teichoic acid export membrane protein
MSIEGREPLQETPAFASTLTEATSTGLRVLSLRLSMYVVGFLASAFIARALGPDGRGLYALPVAFLGIVMALSHVGLENGHVWLAGKGVSLRQLWVNSTVVAMAIGSLAWLIVALLYVTNGSSLFSDLPAAWVLLPVAQIPFLLQTLYWTSLLQLQHRVVAAVTASLAGVGLHAILCVILFAADLLTPFRVLLLMWVVNGTAWLLILGLCWRSGLTGWAPHGPTLRRALSFGMKTWMGSIFFFLVLRVDQILVQRYLGFHELGIYSLAVMLAELLWLVTDPFAVALLPHQIEAARGDELRLTYAAARTSFLVALLGAILGWVLVPYGIQAVYGDAFAGSVWPFRLLLPGVVLLAAQRPLAAILLKRGRPWSISLFGFGALLVDVAVNLLLLPRIGVVGASIASSGCYAGLAVAYVWGTWESGRSRWGDLVPRPSDLHRLWMVVRRPGE